MDKLPVLYVFVNTDLPSMTPGKAQAHSGHAATAFLYHNVVKPQRINASTIPVVSEWMAATPWGFGTQINLKGPWHDVVNTLADYCEAGGLGELITDPTYPYIVDSEIVELIDRRYHSMEPRELDDGRWLCHRNAVTAAYMFGYKEDLEPYLKQYSLHP